MNERDEKFVEWLIQLPDRPNGRAILAELRRGLGQPPGLAPTVARYVQPFLSASDSTKREETYYLVASLFGMHPQATTSGNMGQHFTQLWNDNDAPPENIARRFNILLSADWDTLPDYMRHAISLLKAQGIPVNWAQLLDDVLRWESYEGKVQLQWSRAFWRKGQKEVDSQPTNR